MSLESEFKATADAIKSWNPKTAPGNDEKLALYALFKQATEGDCTTSRPGMFNPVNRAKWDAWNAKKGLSKEEAMKAYIAEVARQRAAYD